jgi:hypothetical protein
VADLELWLAVLPSIVRILEHTPTSLGKKIKIQNIKD